MSAGAKLLAFLVLAGALAAGLQYVRALRAERVVAQNAAKTAQDGLATANDTIKTLRADAKKQADRARAYQRDRDEIATTLAEKNEQHQRLLESNEQVRIWSAGRLPDDVAGLHHHPAYTGAADYLRQRAPGPDSVHVTGNSPQQ